MYELRIFAFYMPHAPKGGEDEIKTFSDFVNKRNLRNEPLRVYSQLRHLQPLAYNCIDDTVYLNIALLPVTPAA